MTPLPAKPEAARRFDWLSRHVHRALQAKFPGEALQHLESRRRAEFTVVMRPEIYACWREGLARMDGARKTPADLCWGFPLRQGPESQAEPFEIVDTPLPPRPEPKP